MSADLLTREDSNDTVCTSLNETESTDENDPVKTVILPILLLMFFVNMVLIILVILWDVGLQYYQEFKIWFDENTENEPNENDSLPNGQKKNQPRFVTKRHSNWR